MSLVLAHAGDCPGHTCAVAAFPWVEPAPSLLPVGWYVTGTAVWPLRGKVGRTGTGSMPGTPGSNDPSVPL